MIDKKIDNLIQNWICENRDEIITQWIALAEIPSVKAKAKPGAPFGENCRKALGFACHLFEKQGFDTQICDDKYALCGYGGGKKKIGLFCHSDVVPAGDGWIYTEPFHPIVKNGALIGRGVEDNKSGIMASLCAMRFLKENGISLRSRLETFIGSDEECSMEDLAAYLKNEKQPALSIVPDADFPCSVGEKGFYHFYAVSRDQFKTIRSFQGGAAFNIVLDSVTVRIDDADGLFAELTEKTAHDENCDVQRDQGEIVLRVRGIAKHASIPEGSLNAAYLAASILSCCEALPAEDRMIMEHAKSILDGYYGEGIGVMHEDADFGKMTCVNGIADSADGHLHLSFDVRFGPSLDAEYLKNISEKHLSELGFSVCDGKVNPGFIIDKSSPVPSAMEEIYRDITGDSLERVLMGGGTYARKLKNTFSVGTFAIPTGRENPPFAMEEGHGGAHQRDEMIDIEGFFTAVRVLIHYILACDGIINE
ncbi:MAG: Sapep family Mn(2+)-dependent dipeptidase [Acutalibacteraceae bacterium]